MINDKIEIAKLLNEYFVNIVKKIRTIYKKTIAVSTENSISEVEITIAKYKNHPSVNGITENMKKLAALHLTPISLRMRKQ